jgi:hypothetical protein
MYEEMHVGHHKKCLNLTKIKIEQQILATLPKSNFMRTCLPLVELLLMERQTCLS